MRLSDLRTPAGAKGTCADTIRRREEMSGRAVAAESEKSAEGGATAALRQRLSAESLTGNVAARQVTECAQGRRR
jgi:hypothetical protein